jgi:predicted GIY-YIG superfamily endonuclease
MGTVYLIHFDRPYHHARHYIGYTDDMDARLARHHAGNGSKLLAAVRKAGIEYEMVRTWEGVGRDFERELKNQKNAPRLCPVCKARKREKGERGS